MIGLFHKRYHVAILENNENIVEVINSIKHWYNDNVVIKIYHTSQSLFQGISENTLKHKPFDMAVLSESNNKAEQLVLKRSNPDLAVVLYKNNEQYKLDLI